MAISTKGSGVVVIWTRPTDFTSSVVNLYYCFFGRFIDISASKKKSIKILGLVPDKPRMGKYIFLLLLKIVEISS